MAIRRAADLSDKPGICCIATNNVSPDGPIWNPKILIFSSNLNSLRGVIARRVFLDLIQYTTDVLAKTDELLVVANISGLHPKKPNWIVFWVYHSDIQVIPRKFFGSEIYVFSPLALLGNNFFKEKIFEPGSIRFEAKKD